MKREETLLRAIGGVDDDLINEAMEPRKKKRPALIRWAAVAACVCLMLTVTVGSYGALYVGAVFYKVTECGF